MPFSVAMTGVPTWTFANRRPRRRRVVQSITSARAVACIVTEGNLPGKMCPAYRCEFSCRAAMPQKSKAAYAERRRYSKVQASCLTAVRPKERHAGMLRAEAQRLGSSHAAQSRNGRNAGAGDFIQVRHVAPTLLSCRPPRALYQAQTFPS